MTLRITDAQHNDGEAVPTTSDPKKNGPPNRHCSEGRRKKDTKEEGRYKERKKERKLNES